MARTYTARRVSLRRCPGDARLSRRAWGLYHDQTLRLSFVDLRRISRVIFAGLCARGSKGSSCDPYIKQCDAGLSCIPLMTMTTGICCARFEEPRPAVRSQGQVLIWKCVRKFERNALTMPAFCSLRQGGVVGKDYNTHQLFCDPGSVCTPYGYYMCKRADGGLYSCCSEYSSCDPVDGRCKPWAGR
jgi:hypothetical protein